MVQIITTQSGSKYYRRGETVCRLGTHGKDEVRGKCFGEVALGERMRIWEISAIAKDVHRFFDTSTVVAVEEVGQ